MILVILIDIQKHSMNCKTLPKCQASLVILELSEIILDTSGTVQRKPTAPGLASVQQQAQHMGGIHSLQKKAAQPAFKLTRCFVF